MVETRASDPVEEGEEESVQDLEAEMAKLAVERAKSKAAPETTKVRFRVIGRGDVWHKRRATTR